MWRTSFYRPDSKAQIGVLTDQQNQTHRQSTPTNRSGRVRRVERTVVGPNRGQCGGRGRWTGPDNDTILKERRDHMSG